MAHRGPPREPRRVARRDGRRAWLGHSFGARLAFEHVAAHPDEVDRLVLLDPAILLPGHVALWAAENGRAERRYASFEEAIDRRYEESQLHRAPRALVEEELRGHLEEDADGWRYRYTQAAVVTAYSEMATQPPPFRLGAWYRRSSSSGRTRTCRTTTSSTRHRDAAGDLLEVVTVPGWAHGPVGRARRDGERDRPVPRLRLPADDDPRAAQPS